MNTELQATISKLVRPGKGILAADESVPTITKRFNALGIELTEESRRAYRALLSTTIGIEEFVAGIICSRKRSAKMPTTALHLSKQCRAADLPGFFGPIVT